MVYVKGQQSAPAQSSWLNTQWWPQALQTLLISLCLSVSLSVCLALNLKAKFKGVSCFSSGVRDSGGTCPPVSDGGKVFVHLADWHLWLVNPGLSLISESLTPQLRGNCHGSQRARGYYCHCDMELYLLARLETSQLKSFNTLKFQFCTVKCCCLVALTGFSVMEWQFLVSLVSWHYVHLSIFLHIPSLHPQLSPASVWCTCALPFTLTQIKVGKFAWSCYRGDPQAENVYGEFVFLVLAL